MSKTDLPDVSQSGEVMAHAGKYARHAVLTVFHQMGGTDAMTEWAKKNQTDFYTKLFPKVIDREPPQQGDRSVEDLLGELDREMIDVTPGREEAPVYEPPSHASPWPSAREALDAEGDDGE